MSTIYQKRIPENEVEELLKNGEVNDDKVGIFIMKMVGAHKNVNDFTAKRYQLTYEELVSDGSFFVLKYIRKFDQKRGRLSTYIYQLIGSFLKVLEKKTYRVQRRIPPNKSHSFHKLEEQTAIVSKSTFEDYKSIEAMFIRVLNSIAAKLHRIELEQVEFKISLDKLFDAIDHLPKIKKVLRLYYEGHDRKGIEAEIGNRVFKESQEEFFDNIEIFKQHRDEFNIIEFDERRKL